MNDLPDRVVEAAESQLGSPYVFGAWGAFCTPEERRKRYKYNPSHTAILSNCQVLRNKNPKPNCDGCQYQGDRCFDCRGFTDWCLKQVGIDLYGDGCTTQYGTKSNWLERGKIEDMPECVCCVFIADGGKKSHTGLYIGGGQTIECSAGVQQKKLDRRWTHYAIPAGLYTREEVETIRENQPRPKRTLRKGDRGADVVALQAALNALGYSCGEADGAFGTKTVKAVKAFQQDHGLTPDGIVGEHTWAALNAGAQVERLYAVTIPHLHRAEVQDLLAKYPYATFTAEG